MEGCADALEEPGPRVNTLMLSRSNSNGEDVPIPVDCRRNEDDAPVLYFEVTSVDTKHFH